MAQPKSSSIGAGDQKLLKGQYNNLREDVLSTTEGHDHTGVSGHGMKIRWDEYICVRDKKAQNTAGGTFTQDAWQKRDINEELADTGGDCAIANDQITLGAGTYRCRISCPAVNVTLHQARLYDTTGSATLVTGTSTENQSSHDTGHSFIIGRFELTEESVLEIQHYCTSTQVTYGFGNACNLTDEVYTVAEFWKEEVS